MRKIVSPLDGIRSPFGRRDTTPAQTLLGSEAQGLALDFLSNTSAVRTT